MNNLHNIGNYHLTILLHYYQNRYGYVTTRIDNNKIQVYNKFTKKWTDENQSNIDELERRWINDGSPVYE